MDNNLTTISIPGVTEGFMQQHCTELKPCGMRTLKELEQDCQRRPRMLEAIRKARREGAVDSTQTMVVTGLCSTWPNSNVAHAAAAQGWKSYKVYAGARAGRRRNDGYYNIIVRRPK